MPKKFYCGSKIYDIDRSEFVLKYGTKKMQITLYKEIHCDNPDWFYICTEGSHCDAKRIDEKYVKNILINRKRQDLCQKHGLLD